MSNHMDINKRIHNFIKEKFPAANHLALADDVALLGSGVVDSLGVLELVAFVEETFQIVVDVDDLKPENFQSIASLATFVKGKLGSRLAVLER